MLPPFDMDLLADALVGGVAGAALVAVLHLWRDRHRLIARWHGGDDKADESTYLSYSPTDEERRKLPLRMAGSAVGGAAFWVGIMHDFEEATFIGLAVLTLAALVETLLGDRATQTGAPPDDETGDPRPSRFIEAGGHLAALGGIAAYFLLDSDSFAWLREDWGITPAVGAAVVFAGVLALGGWELFRLWLRLPNAEDIGYRSAYDTTRQDIYRMLAAIGVTTIFCVLLIWLLF